MLFSAIILGDLTVSNNLLRENWILLRFISLTVASVLGWIDKGRDLMGKITMSTQNGKATLLVIV